MPNIIQGRIQDFLIGGSNLQKGFDLLIVPDYFLFFPKILHENGIILSQRGFEPTPWTPSGSAIVIYHIRQ